MWFKLIRKKKLQSALIFSIITMCTLLITGSVIIITSLNSPYVELFEESGIHDLQIIPNAIGKVSGKDWEGTLRSIDGVKEVQKIQIVSLNALYIKNEKKDLFVNLTLYNKGFEKVRVIEGNLKQLQKGTCAVRSLASNT